LPTKAELQKEILQGTKQDIIRREYLKKLYDHTKRPTIIYATAFDVGRINIQRIPSYLVSIVSEDIRGFMGTLQGIKGDNLDIIIHSPGGQLEVTEQIVRYLRSKFKNIRAIIPQNAMSAATMLACACEELVMGKHSAIGPIDPQMVINTPEGSISIPAQSILEEFEQAKKEVAQNPDLATLWVNRINKYPHGFFQICKDTTELATMKVTEWLDSYMFKDSTANPKPGHKIAEWLGTSSQHKSHGRPIMIDTAKEIGLKVLELESDQTLQELVLSVFHCTEITFEITNCVKLIENHEGKGWFSNIQVAPPPSPIPPIR